MWFITVFEKWEKDDRGWYEHGWWRTWGYYSDHDRALAALHENRTDMHEYCYFYAVLEKLGEGLMPRLESVQWFKFDVERNGYFEIEMPEGADTREAFALG